MGLHKDTDGAQMIIQKNYWLGPVAARLASVAVGFSVREHSLIT